MNPRQVLAAQRTLAAKRHCAALKDDYGPKAKIRKLPPLKRTNDGRIIRKRSKRCTLELYHMLILVDWIREIKHYQKDTGLIFGRLPFMRVVKDITENVASRQIGGLKWRSSAIAAL